MAALQNRQAGFVDQRLPAHMSGNVLTLNLMTTLGIFGCVGLCPLLCLLFKSSDCGHLLKKCNFMSFLVSDNF